MTNWQIGSECGLGELASMHTSYLSHSARKQYVGRDRSEGGGGGGGGGGGSMPTSVNTSYLSHSAR